DQPARLTAQPLYTPGAPAMTDDEAVAEFAELWPQVLQQMRERGGTSRTAVALSGGLDSRAIAAGCVGIGWHPMTYTYGSLRNDETRTAVRIAERLQLPQAVIPVDNEHLLRDLPRILDALDGAHTPGEMCASWLRSGGLDSRAIAAGCVGIGWHPMTYTYGSLRNDETRTAVRIAERLQLPQAVIPVDNEHLLRDLPRILDAMDGAHTPGEMYESWF